jgi:EmrB/QacA subfamily drug resistance transporter
MRTKSAGDANRPLLFGIAAAALLVSGVDNTFVSIALDRIQADFGSSLVMAGWTVTAYSVGMGMALPLSGRLTDRLGAKRTFMGSLVCFGAASLVCANAPNIYILVAARVVQSIGGSGFVPSATALIAAHFGPSRDKALGLFSSVFPLGTIFGPAVGGVVLTYFSWRALFIIEIPFCLLALVLAFKIVPKDSPAAVASGSSGKPRLDWLGALALVASLCAALGPGLSLLALIPQWALVWIGMAFTVASVFGLRFFIRHIHRATNPIIPARLIVGPEFLAINAYTLVFTGFLAGLMAVLPLFLIRVYRFTVLDVGAILIAEGAASLVSATLATLFLRKSGHRLPLFVGAVVSCVGIACIALPPDGYRHLWAFCCCAVIGGALGIASPAARNAILALAPESIGTISGLRSLIRQIGLTIAFTVAIVGGSLASDQATGLRIVFFGFVCVFLACLFLIRKVPDMRGSW